MRIFKKTSVLFIFAVLFFTGCLNGQVVEKKDKKEAKNIRVITTYKPATEIVLALGGKDKLVGTNDGAKKDPIILKLDESLSGRIKEVGSKKNGLNIEQIAALKPDIVIMHPVKEADDTIKKLQEQNIKVISINPETIDSLQSEIIKVGDAIGESENAKKLVDYYNEKLAEIKKRVEGLKDKRSVYIAGANGIFSTASGDYYQHEMIEAAGGINVSSQLKGGWKDVSVEQIITWNPEIITSVMYCRDGNPEKIMSMPELQTVKAVKEKKVYQIPSNIAAWDMPQPSSILAILWMGKTLYPEEFKEINLKETAEDFYKKFYGKSFSELGGTLDGEVDSKK